MEQTKQLTANFLRFMLAGKAIFTLRSSKTGVRYTYKVSMARHEHNQWFVSYLTDGDNESGYTYLGMIRGDSVVLTRASKLNMESVPVVAFFWFFKKLILNLPTPNIEMWHAGHCARCGRLLTVPESIESGYGPECITKVAYAQAA